jgi:lactate 2-monooxygenase
MDSISRIEQKRIYIRGISGARPRIPLSYDGMRKNAEQKLSPEAYAYVVGGAGREETMAENRRAFSRWQIIPSMLPGRESVDLSTDYLGKKRSSPFFLAPIGVLDMAYPKGDLAVAGAAASEDIPNIFSSQASEPMEACARNMGDKDRWFQLYYSRSQDLVKSLVQRAEKCGCSAIVVTLDTTRLGWRRRDLDLGFLPFLRGRGIAQYTSDPTFQNLLDEREQNTPKSEIRPAISYQTLKTLWRQKKNYPGGVEKWFSKRPTLAVQTFIDIFSRSDLDWEDIQRLRDYTALPIILKGIQTAEDARQAISIGIDGLYISNHGGRQVDGACASLNALPAIRKIAGPDYPVFFDSGIRSGADAMKALCLGATAVGIGRPYVLALALDGEKGVQSLLRYYKAELEQNMFLSGAMSIDQLNNNLIRKTES